MQSCSSWKNTKLITYPSFEGRHRSAYHPENHQIMQDTGNQNEETWLPLALVLFCERFRACNIIGESRLTKCGRRAGSISDKMRRHIVSEWLSSFMKVRLKLCVPCDMPAPNQTLVKYPASPNSRYLFHQANFRRLPFWLARAQSCWTSRFHLPLGLHQPYPRSLVALQSC